MDDSVNDDAPANDEPVQEEVIDRAAEAVDSEAPPRLTFPVVGIGASAGGLEAFLDFFRAMSPESGMAFVLIQHLPPDRESLMADILSKHTSMTVTEVEDGDAIEPNHVYCIRPGHTLTIKDGRLHLGAPLAKPGNNRPIDDFFRSLAEEQRQRAIAIILSGMGSNGTLGAQQVKAVGGICIAQDPESAKFPSMPRHLIEAGQADFILRPPEMPEVLRRYADHPYTSGQTAANAILRKERQHFTEILAILRTRTRLEFGGYKKATLLRRIQRRMGLMQLTELEEYAKLLRQSPAEVSALADDLMIHVTGFFRDIDAWDVLRQRTIEPLIHQRENDAPIRCWVTACSSGEEAYTLAILLIEAAEAAGKQFDIKIFATDTAERSLQQARNGIYPGGIEAEVSPERLARFFERDDAMYRVKKELREMVVFAPQNVLQDPPFSRLDICTCRNLLIYLEPDMQERILRLLHFGLREGGILFLGTSETINTTDGLFEILDKKARVFRRIGPTQHGTVDFTMPLLPASADRDLDPARSAQRTSLAQLTNRALLDRYTPAAVTIDRDHRIVYYHGQTENFLLHPRGEPTRDVMEIVKESIRPALRSALHAATRNNEPASVRDGFIETGAGRARIVVSVAPLESKLAAGYFLVTFEEHLEAPVLHTTEPTQEAEDQAHAKGELSRVREELQSTIEELQSSNEELKASNEEVTSINEELQSSNEELETSKEELQSLNEELSTVNAQLHSKMEELESTTNDLASLLSSTDIAVVFLDTQLRIRRFTPAVKDLFELIPSDIGRPLNNLALKFTDPDLLPDSQLVLERLIPITKEVASNSHRWYERRILPYRTADNHIEGVVVTFVDITERKKGEEDLRKSKLEAEGANEAKDLFLANISHELRTPLSSIMLWTRSLITQASGSSMREGLEAIEASAALQAKLVEDLLDGARIAKLKLSLNPQHVPLVTLLRECAASMLPIAQQKSVELKAETAADLGVVRADPFRLKQVIVNLLSNAIKFTPAGGKVTLAASRKAGEVEISVRDTGAGIDQKFLPRLFERFAQQNSEDVTQLGSGGLGLGLSIAHEVVRLHGGTIAAHSDGPAKGSEFVITLPLPAILPSNPAAS